MTEASRVQKLLNEQKAEINRLKIRIEHLEAALRKIADIEHEDLPKPSGAAEGTLWVILAGCVEVAEAALKGSSTVLDQFVRKLLHVHPHDMPEGEIYGVPMYTDGKRIFPLLSDDFDLYVARAALEGKKDGQEV